ncbi:hypothetical protein AAE478_009127 [Parahypoxylon ruwenzoriense]
MFKNASDYFREKDVSLAGKVAIVTGAGCEGDGLGNGRAISILLAEDGASVVCADLNLAWAEKTSDILRLEGKGKGVGCQGDVTKPGDCQKIVDITLSKFGRIDILVNNVGIMGAKGTATEFDLDQWRRGLDINVTSMANMVKVVVPEMRKNDESLGQIRGSIVNMSSVAGLVGGTPHLLYPTSKGAVLNMTRAMAAHHASDGIRVNCPDLDRDAVHAYDIREGHKPEDQRGAKEQKPFTNRGKRVGLRDRR